MISLDQIQLLEQKIEIAVGKIVRITEENLSLHREIQRLRTENESLQGIITKSQDEQIQIEQGILNVIDRLEAIETTVLETVVLNAEQGETAAETNAEEFSEDSEAQNEQGEVSAPPYAEFEAHSVFEPELENTGEAHNTEANNGGGFDDFEIAPDPKPENENGQLEIF
jgi:chromosome segregation ATPase